MKKITVPVVSSEFTVITDTGHKYYFSSELHKTKFLERINENRSFYNNKYSAMFDATLRWTLLPDLILYSKIENRGFRIDFKGHVYRAFYEVSVRDSDLISIKEETINAENPMEAKG